MVNRDRSIRRLALFLIVMFGMLTAWAGYSGKKAAEGDASMFHDAKAQTLEFIAFDNSIQLNPEQEAIRTAALSGLPAPCCADKTARTCCCDCNMAKSWWGLSKHLIADRGFNADEVRTAVNDWFQFINPDGFSGDACYKGGCNRSFAENGCGGMVEANLAF